MDKGTTLVCDSAISAEVYDGSRRHNYQPFGDVAQTVQAQYGTGGNNTPIVVGGGETYDARGNGDGSVACTITGDHQSRITDYTAIVIDKEKREMEEENSTVKGGDAMNDVSMVVRRLTPL